MGPSRHVMTYPIASGKSFNMVLSHPYESTEDLSNLPQQSLPEILKEMRSQFAGWDPRLTKVISLIHTTLKWPLKSIPPISTYLHSSSKLLILGDGAHAMLPYMSQGAAMAVEDGAALAEALHFASSRSDVERSLQIWNDVRVERSGGMQEASLINGTLWHFPDGPEQEARDKAMSWEVSGSKAKPDTVNGQSEAQPLSRKSPNQWSDLRTSNWCFGYDAEKEMRRLCNQGFANVRSVRHG